MDSEENGQEAVKPQLVAINALSLDPHFVGESYQQQQPQQHQGEPHVQQRHAYPTRYSERLQSVMMPSINVLPATPTEDIPIQRQYLDHVSANTASPLMTGTMLNSGNTTHLAPPIDHSPSISYSHDMTTPKRRIAFGPRAGCEKCRQGVPGHFTHIE